MLAVLLIILSVSVSSLQSVLIKVYNKNGKTSGYMFNALLVLFSMLFFVVTAKDGLSFNIQILPYAIVGGILYCVASLVIYVAYGCGSYTMTHQVMGYSKLIPITYGIVFLNERLKLIGYIGVVLLFVAGFLLRGKSDGEQRSINLKWLICAVFSAVGNGLFVVVQRAQQVAFDGQFKNEFMIIVLLISALVMFAMALKNERGSILEITKKGLPFAAVAGLSNGVVNMVLMVVTALMPMAMYYVINGFVGTLVVFAYATFLFKEKYIPRQVVGIILITLATLLLKL